MKTIVVYELIIRITEEKFRTELCFLIERSKEFKFWPSAGDWYLWRSSSQTSFIVISVSQGKTWQWNYLRASVCKNWEVAARLQKSKFLILCLNDTYGELFSKMLSNLSEISSFREIQKNRKLVFTLIKYAKFKLKVKEVWRCHTTTCAHKRKQKVVFNLVYLSNRS